LDAHIGFVWQYFGVSGNNQDIVEREGVESVEKFFIHLEFLYIRFRWLSASSRNQLISEILSVIESFSVTGGFDTPSLRSGYSTTELFFYSACFVKYV
jgi:hypothetical protein